MSLSHRSTLKLAVDIARYSLLSIALASCAKSTPDTASQQPTEPFPHFGTSASFAALSGQTIINNGNSIIYGDLGVSPGIQITGLASVKSTGGTVHQSDGVAKQAQQDAVTAYNNLQASPCSEDLTGKDLGGLTLQPGTYCFSSDATLTGILTLDAQNNPDADFVFKVNGTLIDAVDSAVVMLNQGKSCDVFWQVSGEVTLGDGSNIAGGILSLTDITLDNGAMLNGKLISRNGTISMTNAQIYNNFCPWP